MHKTARIILGLLLALVPACALRAQRVGLKTNALYWAATAPNLGVEVGLAPRWTLDVGGVYRPFRFRDNDYARFWMVQPEGRYWFCEAFEGHFVGLHAHAGQFYAGGGGDVFDGHLAGGGLTYGYDWILSPHWNLEAAVGVGYARLWYARMPDIPCVKCREPQHSDYWGLTKLALTFTYVF